MKDALGEHVGGVWTTGALVLVVCVAGTAVPSGSAGSAKAPWVISDLGTLGGAFAGDSEGVAIHHRGQVIGNSYSPNVSCARFLWENGRMINLATLSGGNASTSCRSRHDSA